MYVVRKFTVTFELSLRSGGCVEKQQLILKILIIFIPVQFILYHLQFDQRLHNYIKHNNYE